MLFVNFWSSSILTTWHEAELFGNLKAAILIQFAQIFSKKMHSVILTSALSTTCARLQKCFR